MEVASCFHGCNHFAHYLDLARHEQFTPSSPIICIQIPLTYPALSNPPSMPHFFFFFFFFPTGLVRLYIAGLPLRSCRTIGAPSVQGSAQCAFFRFWLQQDSNPCPGAFHADVLPLRHFDPPF